MRAPSSSVSTRERLLEATSTTLALYGPRKVALADVARVAGVSRPTLYKYFPAKDALLEALAEREHHRFDDGFVSAVRDLDGEARIEAALRFMVEHQAGGDHSRQLVAVEPGFVLERVAMFIDITRRRLVELFELQTRHNGVAAEDMADAMVRVSFMHYLIPSDDSEQLLRQLRRIASIAAPSEA